MDQRISLLTLAVADLERSRAFYLDGLGWTAHLFVAGEVLMIRAGEQLLLSFWVESGFEAEVGKIRRGPGIVPVTIAHNVGSKAEVDAVLALAAAAGAREVVGAVAREWGGHTGYAADGTPDGFVHGYSGYFADPDGYRWEIAFNPEQTLRFVLPG